MNTKISQVINFSIIVPIHNAEATIVRCVESLLAQKGLVQIILVDDHSNDNSYSLCETYQNEHENVLVIKSNGRGVSAARNTGLSFATGDIIGFCDADDYYYEDTLACVSQKFLDDPSIDIIVMGITRVRLGQQVQEDSIENRAHYMSSSDLIKQMPINKNIMGSVWNKFYQATIINGIVFNCALSHCEDTYFNCQVLSMNRKLKIYVINKCGYNYVVSSSSVTGNNSMLYDNEGRLKYIETYKSIMNQCELYKSERNVYKYAIVSMAIDYLIKGAYPQKGREYLISEVKRCSWESVFCALTHSPLENIIRLVKLRCLYKNR